MRTIIIFSLIAILSYSVGFAQKQNSIKSYACKIITLKGKVYQSLLLGTDWYELPSNHSENAFAKTSIKSKDADNATAHLDGNNVIINIKLDKYTVLNFNLITLNGLRIASWQENVGAGGTTISKELSELSSGIYILTINSGGNPVKVLKLIRY